MKAGKSILLCIALVLAGSKSASAHAAESSTRLQNTVDSAIAGTIARFQTNGLKSEELAVTVVDLSASQHAEWASHRGDQEIYPASVIKLFYLAAAHRWMEDKRIEDSPELRRAMKDMIVESYNEATHYVVDVLTGTTSGPELPESELAQWVEKRNVVTRYFESLGYNHVVACKKPWCEGPYGRESQAIKAHKPNRNMLSTDSTARLMVEISTGKCVSSERSRQMMELMRRDPWGPATDPDDQSRFTGPGYPKGTRVWSKAGWTSETRHDAVYAELPDGRKLVMVLFSVNHSNDRAILQDLTSRILGKLPVR